MRRGRSSRKAKELVKVSTSGRTQREHGDEVVPGCSCTNCGKGITRNDFIDAVIDKNGLCIMQDEISQGNDKGTALYTIGRTERDLPELFMFCKSHMDEMDMALYFVTKYEENVKIDFESNKVPCYTGFRRPFVGGDAFIGYYGLRKLSPKEYKIKDLEKRYGDKYSIVQILIPDDFGKSWFMKGYNFKWSIHIGQYYVIPKPDEEENSKSCSLCGITSVDRYSCSSCAAHNVKIYYCREKCQKAHWSVHKLTCYSRVKLLECLPETIPFEKCSPEKYTEQIDADLEPNVEVSNSLPLPEN